MECNRESMREWGEDLERRILAAKTRVGPPVLGGEHAAGAGRPAQKPHGFLFAWPPQENPKNQAWRRALRSIQVHRSWRALATHKHEMTGGCTQCYATEATQLGAEAPGFVHKHCYYCNSNYLG